MKYFQLKKDDAIKLNIYTKNAKDNLELFLDDTD